MKTPTQIATESMKGCGNSYGIKLHSEMLRERCGDLKLNQKTFCPSCKKVNQTHKQDWEGEFEFLKSCGYNEYNDIEEAESCGVENEFNRISILTQALKILEGGK